MRRVVSVWLWFICTGWLLATLVAYHLPAVSGTVTTCAVALYVGILLYWAFIPDSDVSGL